MKAINPAFVKKADAKADAMKKQVVDFITAQAGQKVDFDDIRAAMPAATRAEFTDGAIHAMCNDAGLTVEP